MNEPIRSSTLERTFGNPELAAATGLLTVDPAGSDDVGTDDNDDDGY